MTTSPRIETPVWDLPTRLFHWSLVLLVGTNLFLIGPRGGLDTVIHFVAGYLILGLLVFRLAWGFIGSPRSRFRDFVHRWPTVSAYLGRLVRFDPPHSVGHNPLGGWMIVLLLAILGTMIATGLFATGRHGAGPLAAFLPVDWTAVAGDIHQLVSNLLIGLIIVHVAGVAAEWLLTGDNLVRAMVNGRKKLAAEVAARERPVAPVRRAALVGLVAAALVGLLVAATDFSASRDSLRALQAGGPAPSAALSAPLQIDTD
jgi:cytochrome b